MSSVKMWWKFFPEAAKVLVFMVFHVMQNVSRICQIVPKTCHSYALETSDWPKLGFLLIAFFRTMRLWLWHVSFVSKCLRTRSWSLHQKCFNIMGKSILVLMEIADDIRFESICVCAWGHILSHVWSTTFILFPLQVSLMRNNRLISISHYKGSQSQ